MSVEQENCRLLPFVHNTTTAEIFSLIETLNARPTSPMMHLRMQLSSHRHTQHHRKNTHTSTLTGVGNILLNGDNVALQTVLTSRQTDLMSDPSRGAAGNSVAASSQTRSGCQTQRRIQSFHQYGTTSPSFAFIDNTNFFANDYDEWCPVDSIGNDL